LFQQKSNISFCILFCKLIFCHSQSDLKNNLSLRTDLHYGFVLPEYQFFNSLVNAPISSVEFSLNKKTIGKNIWEQVYGYPEYGISILYTSLGNKNIFGNELAIYPYFKNFIIRREKFNLTTQIGVGLGYATRKFDLVSNPQNVAIGSHLNIHFNFKLGASFMIAPRWWLNSGLSFSHFSNANTAEPNLGHNFLTAFTGLQYDLAASIPRQSNTLNPFEKQHEWALIYGAGGKHTRALQSKYYFTSSVSAEYKYHWKRKLHIGAGLDLFYDSSTEIEMSIPGKEKYKPQFDYRTGVHISQELVYDRFSFILQQGLYVGLTNRVDKSNIYNRAILRWKFNAHLLANFSFKSHLHILEYPELGIGYYFTSKK
jgi:hypothetical protein